MSEARITYTGCKEAHEITMTRGGANPGALVLAKMSRDAKPALRHTPAPTDPNPESSNMDAKVLKALAAMSEVTRAYLGDLPDDKVDAFMAKSAAERDKKATDAAEAKKTLVAEEAARAAGKTAREVELETKLGAAEKRLGDLETRETERSANAQFMETARSEFSGYPGGSTAAAAMLKTASKLDKDGADSVKELMRSNITSAQAMGVRKSGHVEADDAAARPAQKSWNEALEKHMSEKGVTRSEATVALQATAKGKELMSAAMEEDQAARG